MGTILGFIPRLSAHLPLLRDRYRNGRFQRAITNILKRGDVVLDIGTGTGIWAILAARLGARRVYAVEKDKIIRVAEKAAMENKVYQRIRFIKGELSGLKLNEKVDLIISETIGNLGFDEDIIDLMILAKRRFLKRGGKVIPRKIELFALPYYWDQMPPVKGVSLNYCFLDQVFRNILLPVRERKPPLLSTPRAIFSAELDKIDSSPFPYKRQVNFRIRSDSKLNGFLLWFEAVLDSKVRLSSLGPSHWSQIFCPLTTRLNLKRGDLIWLCFIVTRAEGSFKIAWEAKLQRGPREFYLGCHGQDLGILHLNDALS